MAGKLYGEKHPQEVQTNWSEPLDDSQAPAEPTETNEIIAKTMGIGSGIVKKMKRIATLAPERVDDIRQGKKTVNAVMNGLI